MGRAADFFPLADEALRIATEAVEREAGNLGALRSRALLRNRKAQAALDRYDYAGAEKGALETAADWTEFLRFDSANDTARNNRRVALGLAVQALWRQGRFDAAIEISKQNTREVIATGGSPSTVRGTAFGTERVDDLEADLGRVKDVDAAMTDWKRLRELSVAQVDAESYFRFSHPVWNENQRATLLHRSGRSAEALESARQIEARIGALTPQSGQEMQSHRILFERNRVVQTEANLALGRWADATRTALELVRGRPTLDDTSESALDMLASDRALAAVALARNHETADARTLLDHAAEFNRARRAAGANDHESRHQTAMISLARGLLAGSPAEKKAAFTAGLAEIAAMAAQPQQLRSVRELKAVLEAELARISL